MIKREPVIIVLGLLFFVGATGLLLLRARRMVPHHLSRPPAQPIHFQRRKPAPRADALQCPGTGLRIHWHIYPLGKRVREKWLRQLKQLLGAMPLGGRASVHMHTPAALPQQAFSRRYRRYRAEVLLDALGEGLSRPQGCVRHFAVGVTAVDVSSQLEGYRDHAVFGLADRGGPAMILSSYRLSKLPKAQREAVWRHIVAHEVGHILGMPHCDKERCVMHPAHGDIRRILRAGNGLCWDCRKRLREYLER